MAKLITNKINMRRLIAALFAVLFTAKVCCADSADKPSKGTEFASAPRNASDNREFKLTVIILTMDRHYSLARVLRSIANTDFEFDDDYFDVEIHVDKSIGEHYEECVK